MSERTVSIYMETQPESHSIPELVVERIHAAYDRLLTAKRDFEADEAGLLPKGLKRGVLSEDGIYDLLEEYKELSKQHDM